MVKICKTMLVTFRWLIHSRGHVVDVVASDNSTFETERPYILPRDTYILDGEYVNEEE